MSNGTTMRVRWGASLSISFTLTDDYEDMTSLTFSVGVPGPNAPIISQAFTIANGVASLFIASVEEPVGEYKYQYTAVFADGSVEKYPDMDGYSDELPDFIIGEVVDEVES